MEGKSNTSGRLQHEELTGQIIGAGIHVHRELGPGFVESIYANALATLEIKRVVAGAFARAGRLPAMPFLGSWVP